MARKARISSKEKSGRTAAKKGPGDKKGEDVNQLVESLIYKEKWLEALVDVAPVGLGIVVERVFVEINQKLCEIFGYSREELIGQSARIVYHSEADFKEVGEKKYAQIAQGGSGYVESPMRCKDGSSIHAIIGSTLLDKTDPEKGTVFTILDITDRKRAEEELARSASQYLDLVETSQDLIWRCDSEGRYTYLNSAWEEVLGFRHEEMIGRPFTDFQDEEYSMNDREVFKRLSKGEIVKGHETIHFTKSGEVKYLVFSAKSVWGENGSFQGTVGTAYDITGRKLFESRLEESEKLLKSITENIPNSFISVIESDMTVGYSAGLEFKKLKLKPEEFHGLTIEQVFGEKSEVVRSYYQKAFEGDEQEFELYMNNQHQVYRVIPLEDSEGRINRILSVVENVTTRKESENKLRESEEKFRTLALMAPAGIYMTDKNGSCIYTNPEWDRMAGMESGEALGEKWALNLHPDDRESVYTEWLNTIRNGEFWSSEYRFKRPDGEVHWVKGLATPMFNENGQLSGYIGINMDITRWVLNERELLHKNEQLEYLNQNFVGREIKMIELKREVNSLLKEAGKNEKYIIHDEIDETFKA